MTDAAAAAGRTLMEAFMYRFHPRSRRISRLVREGAIGAIRSVRCAFCYRMDPALMQTGGQHRLRAGSGGALLDVGCYGVSVARWFFGAEPDAVSGQAMYHTGGTDIHFVGVLRFTGKGMAVVEASFVSALQQTYGVWGTDGALELPHDAFIPWEKESIYTFREATQESGRICRTPPADEYRLMVEHFVDVVRGRRRPLTAPDESVRNMRVLDALRDAARTGRTVIPAAGAEERSGGAS
jgi:predicted dehydrogenase